MFTAAKLKTAETYLSRHLVANDYYSENEKVTGLWMGKGAELLGLHGQAIGEKDAAFEALRTNRDPRSDEPLTQRTGESRVAFHDWQVSAPKSVSVLAVTYGDERLRQAHAEAVAEAFQELERFAARRLRDGAKANSNESVFTGNLVTAAFTHDASRALDAQLHTHLVCANATFDASTEKWYALQNGEMFKAAELAGRIYQNALAQRVMALGYEIRLDCEGGKTKGFEIAGVSALDMELQSTRRKQIEAEIEKFANKHGRQPTSGERHVMATSTRDSKLAEIATAEVRAGQISRYGVADQGRLTGLVAAARAREGTRNSGTDEHQRTPQIRAAISSAIEHIAERHSVFDARAVLARALRENPGMVGYRAARELLAENPENGIVALNGIERDPCAPEETRPMTTTENLRLENEAVEMIQEGKGRCLPLATSYQLNPQLTGDQKAAVEQILTSHDQFQALLGPAGTGKTTTLSSLDAVVRDVASHTNAIYVAPTHQAKGVLQRDGFKETTTIARLLVDLGAKRIDLTDKLLVVDEAGMLSTRDGHAVQCAVRQAGARCLFVGDPKQIPSVAAGDHMAISIKHGKIQTAQLTTIFRQRENPDYLRAMEKMATGDVKGALMMLDQQGRIKEAGGNYLEQAAAAYCAATSGKTGLNERDPATVALVAPTWREIGLLTGFVRQDRQTQGQLTGPEVKREVIETCDHTAAERRTERTYRPGMMVAPSGRAFGGLRKNEWQEITAVGEGNLLLANGGILKLETAGARLLVGERKQIPLQVGDRILVLYQLIHQLFRGVFVSRLD